jgi:hypothetical protein
VKEIAIDLASANYLKFYYFFMRKGSAGNEFQAEYGEDDDFAIFAKLGATIPTRSFFRTRVTGLP